MLRSIRALLADISRLWRGPKDTPDPPQERVPDRSGPEPAPPITILAVLADDGDHSVVTDLARRNRWEMRRVESLDGTRRLSASLHPQIILLDRDVAGREWRGFIADVAASSGACVVLVSTVLDDNLWNEVVCNGGYEVLSKPLREEQVSRTVRMARSYWTTANKWASAARK